MARAGLIGWWPTEGNANDRMSPHNGILLGEATFSPGKGSQALSFDPASRTMSVLDLPSLRESWDIRETFQRHSWETKGRSTSRDA